jgi:hypothetical protein
MINLLIAITIYELLLCQPPASSLFAVDCNSSQLRAVVCYSDELFNGLNLNREIAVGLCVEGPVLLNIWESPHRSRQSSYHTQFILTS